MGRYGSRADEPETGAGGNDGEVWIKGIQKGNTRVRILQPTSTFHRWREHFEGTIKAFMCDGTDECPGCNDADEEVQRRNRKYGFNCITQDGRLTVLKIGPKFFEKLQRKEQWHNNTLMDRDWILIRTGERLETDYDAEAGEKYAVEMPKEIYDIENLVGRDYWEARRAYGLSVDEAELKRCREEEMVKGFDAPATVVAGPAEGGDEAQATAGEAGPAEESASKDPKTWPTSQLKAYLTENGVDFPEKAPRSRLVAIADEHLIANPGF